MKKKFTFILLFFVVNFSHSQSWQWVQTYDYGSEDMPRGFGIDANNNLYLITNEYYDHGSTAHSFMYLCKYDEFGNEIWKDSIASNIRNSVTDAQGTTYCIGGGKVQAFDHTGSSIWSTGTFLATNQKDICYNNFLNDAQVCSYGYNSGIITSVIGSVKLDGTLRWSRVVDSSAAFLCASDSDGNLIIISETFPDAATGNYCSLSKYDTMGNLTFTVNIPHLPNDMVVDFAGNVYVSGKIPSGTPTNIAGTVYSAPFGSTNPNSFLLKYDADGNLLWFKFMRNVRSNLVIDSQNFLYLTAAGKDVSVDTLIVNQSNAFMLVVKLDPNGNIVWYTGSSATTTMAFVSPRGIVRDSEDNIFVAGELTRQHSFGSQTANGEHDYYDNFIAKLSQSSSTNTSENLFVSTDLFVSPNPAHNEISLSYTPSSLVKKIRIAVRNSEGKELLVRELQNVNTVVNQKFDIANYSSGIYFVDLDLDGLRMSKKVIIN
jgi:hypothetical protein